MSRITVLFRGAMYQTNSSGAHVLVIANSLVLDNDYAPQLDMTVFDGNRIVFIGSYSFDRIIRVVDGRYEPSPVTNDTTIKIAYTYAIAQALDQEYDTTEYTDCLKKWLSFLLGTEVDFGYTDIFLTAQCNTHAMGALLFLKDKAGVPGFVRFIFSPASLLIITNDEVCSLINTRREELLEKQWEGALLAAKNPQAPEGAKQQVETDISQMT